MKTAIVGGGVIGGGWAARFLLNGWNVAVFDPDPDAERKINEVVANARRSLPSLYDRLMPTEGTLTFHAEMADAVSGADWVQESIPERLELKHNVLCAISELAAADAVIGSSTSGFKPSELNGKGARAIVAHPFNPVYLLPLVELVGDAGVTAKAADILKKLGMFPLILRKEIDALHKNGVRVRIIGDRDRLDADIRQLIERAESKTAGNQRMTLVVALNYGARFEIVEAARQLAQQVALGELDPDQIDEQRFDRALSTQGLPDPDLLIRTSGEQRISNFLLWQLAYTELFFSSKLWPEFTRDDLEEAFENYAKRERRYGAA